MQLSRGSSPGVKGLVGRRPCNDAMSSEWATPEHALDYLQRAERVPHGREGGATLREEVPEEGARILPLGSGAGGLLGLLPLAALPSISHRRCRRGCGSGS